MSNQLRFALALTSSFAVASSFAACSSPPPEPAAGCNPVIGDDCTTPFPSSFYEMADASSPTGVRVHIADGVLPVTNSGIPFKAAQLQGRDGFSPATPFVVYFERGVDPAELPTTANLDASVAATSTVQVIDMASGQRLPVMAELDAGASVAAGDRQALLIHPMVRLDNGKRYVIALVGLKDPNGGDLTPAPFKALRDKGALNHALEPLKARYEEIFAALAAAGVARNTVTLAWDVHTASDDSATSHLVAMRDQALMMADAGMLSYTVTSSTDMPSDAHLLREVVGTFDVPWYLTSSALDATLGTDGGMPTMHGTGTANFVVHIPKCASTATGPLPVIVFGHGLFGTAQSELSSDYEKQVGDTLCMVQIGTDWIGLSKPDFNTVGDEVLGDLNHIDIVTDRLQQAHVNAQTLTRLFKTKMKDDPALQVNGHAVTDASQIYYYGISDGGIQGGTFMALSEDIVRGVLNVPGCEWSLMMLRSHDFQGLKTLLDSVYPDQLDQQVLVAAMQSYWDFSDPATFAPHVIGAPLPSAPAKRILVQEAIGDAQVPNIATRVLVRTLGVPGNDLEQPVWGVSDMPAPLDSAYTQWDIHPMPLPPDGDIPPPTDNGAHEDIRALPLLVQQLQAFFTPTGQVVQTCTGPCVSN